jgi:hypothetical protein
MADYTVIHVRFSKDQSPTQRGKQLKTAQFEGYVDTRPLNINNELYNIDIKTPYLPLKDAIFLEAQIESTDGSPFYLISGGENLGLFRVRPFTWTVDEKPTLTSKLRSLQFKVEKAYGILSDLVL